MRMNNETSTEQNESNQERGVKQIDTEEKVSARG
jgi:hypothetical protein